VTSSVVQSAFGTRPARRTRATQAGAAGWL
jgi:hypothetical protein